MNKEIWSIEKLRLWKDNPRGIKEKDFLRLKKQIQKLGQYKPLVVTSSGEVLGGNMRLAAYRELGITDIWVSVVEPKSDAEKAEEIFKFLMGLFLLAIVLSILWD